MSVSLSKEQLATFARLGRLPDGQQLLAIVKTWQTDVDKTLRTATDAALLRAQGDAQRLEELAELIGGGAEARLRTLPRTMRPVMTEPLGY